MPALQQLPILPACFAEPPPALPIWASQHDPACPRDTPAWPSSRISHIRMGAM